MARRSPSLLWLQALGAQDLRLKPFLEYLDLEKNRSPHRVAGYARNIGGFLKFLDRRSTPLLRLDAPDLKVFVQHLRKSHSDKGRVRNISSVARAVAAVRVFLRHLYRQGQVSKDLTTHLEAPSRPKKLPLREAS